MATKIQTKGKHASDTAVIRLALGVVREDVGFNARSGDFTEGSGTDEHGFQEIYESIKEKGQDTPVDVVPDPKKAGHYLLRTGHRRFRALQRIQEETKQPQTILAKVRELDTEAEAFSLNLRENAARENMKPSDLAFGLKRLRDSRTADGTFKSDVMIYNETGFAQSYGAKLMKIATNLLPELFKHWRESSNPLGVPDLYDIAKQEQSKQKELYEAAIKPRENSDGSRAPSRQNKVDKLEKKALAGVELLANLVAAEVIKEQKVDFADHDVLTVLMGYPNELPTKAQMNKIGKAAVKHYLECYEAATEELEEENEG